MLEEKLILLKSEAGFQVLFNCATVSIIVINESGKILLSNPCAEKLFGYEPAELIGQPLEILIPETHRKKHEMHRMAYFTAPKDRPMGIGMELFARKKDGSIFPVEISLGHYSLEDERLAVAFVTDITAQVKAKSLIAEREAWFRNMADNSPIKIWVADSNKNFKYFNKTWLDYTGRKLEAELGDGWLESVHPEDFKTCVESFERAYSTLESMNIEFRLKDRKGDFKWMQFRGKPTYSEDNKFTGYIGSCVDIHEQRKVNEELELMVRQRTNELHEALAREIEINELKSRFVSLASHEFRTPLSVVLSSTSLIELIAGQEVDGRIKKHLDRIKSSIMNLNGILNDFLSLDKLEQGKVDLDYETFEIDGFIQTIAEELKILQKKGQTVQIVHTGEPHVTLDRNKLKNIMINLISNAIKYSPEDTEVHISSMIDDDFLSITVRDNGIGIPESEHQKLFSKFFRASNTNYVSGTGLGLTIVKRYVELLGGTITFSSKLNHGSTFNIRLPKS